jgi:Leucine-rich repeat (LRR) protein
LNGTLISTLGELRHLTHLYLNDCSLTGNIPLSIGRLTKLGESRVCLHRVNENARLTLVYLHSITEGLGLHDNLLTGTIPETLGNLENLLALYLDDNRINGTIPISLGSLSSLVDLRLRKNKVCGYCCFVQ